MEEIEFTHRGKRYRLTRAQVIESVRGVVPGLVSSLAVEIEGIEYPVKQPFGLATGLDIADFTSHEARDKLVRLGFSVSRVRAG
jgi:hypothetical protein